MPEQEELKAAYLALDRAIAGFVELITMQSREAVAALEQVDAASKTLQERIFGRVET
jgi:hypothetical protein